MVRVLKQIQFLNKPPSVAGNYSSIIHEGSHGVDKITIDDTKATIRTIAGEIIVVPLANVAVTYVEKEEPAGLKANNPSEQTSSKPSILESLSKTPGSTKKKT